MDDPVADGSEQQSGEASTPAGSDDEQPASVGGPDEFSAGDPVITSSWAWSDGCRSFALRTAAAVTLLAVWRAMVSKW